MAHHEIYFKASQAGENGDYEDLRPLTGGRLVKVWDGYEDGQLLSDIGLTAKTIRKFYQARIDQASSRGATFSKTEKGCLLYNDLRNYEPEDYETIFMLALWSDEALKQWIDQFCTWLQDTEFKADSVGGDDSTYDYYPDRWDVAAQIADTLGMQEVYRKHRTAITTGLGRYAQEDLPDYIPEI